MKRMTAEEVKDLTKRTRHKAQIRVLQHMGIRHQVHPDGSPVVYEADVRPWANDKQKGWEPDLKAFDSGQTA